MSSSIRPGSKGNRVVLSAECLEDRTVPAGNITAFVSGGVLHVSGDSQSNQVWVMGLDHGQAIVAPLNGTTVNGSAGPVVLGGIAFAYDLRTGYGNDFLWVTNTKGPISVFADTGAGSDNLTMDYAENTGTTFLSTGSDDDTMSLGMDKFQGPTHLDLGAGDDRVFIGGGEFGYVVFNGGAGKNAMGILGVGFHAFPITMGFQSVYSGLMPTANNDTMSVRPGQSRTINVSANDTAPASSLNRSSIRITQQPRNGIARVNGDGTITYTAFADATSAVDSFKYTIRSTNGAESNEGVVSLKLSGVAVTPPGAPIPTITSSASNPTDLASIPFTVTFNEAVTGFDASDIDVTNGTVSNFSGSGTTYTFNVAPTHDGAVTINLAAGAGQDSGGTPSAARSFTITSERSAPSVTISSSASSPTNADPIPFTVTFSEDVNDFVQSDIRVTGGTISGFTKVDGRTYRFNVAAPASGGTITVNVDAGVAHDAANKPNTAATEFSIVSERAAPTVEISSNSTSPTKANPIQLTATFSEDVQGFKLNDIVVQNGTAANFQMVNARTYTFTVTPSLDGTVTVRIPENVAQDNTGLGNPEKTFSIVSDRTVPTVTVSSSVTSGSTATSPIPYTVTFSENVTDFTAGDVFVQNGSVMNFTAVDAKTYTFSVVPAASGNVIVTVPANVAEDPAANGNGVSNTLTINFTGTAVTATITADAGITNPTNLPSIPMTIQFSEAVTGFDASKISVTNGTVSNFVAVDGDTYTFTVAPTADGEVQVTVAAGAGTGTSGPSAAANFTIVSDRTGPVATLTTGATSPTNLDSLTYTVTFDEDATDFTLDDVTVINGTASNFQMVNSRTFTFDVAPIDDGDVTVMVEAGAAQDALGNASPESIPSTVVSDRTDPTVAINGSTPIAITGTADDVSDVTGVQVSIFNGTNYWDGDGFDSATEVFHDATSTDNFATWSLAFATAGTYTVHARATDAAGNIGEFTNTSVVVVAAVTTTISAPSGVTSPTSLASLAMTVQFGESVSGFDASDLVVNGATVTNFTGNGATYTFTLTPTGDGTVTVSIAAGAATALLGGEPTAAANFSIVSDRTVPTATITTTATNPTSADAIPYLVTFNEDVTDFDASDLNVTNGTVSNFVAVNGRTYSFNVIPTPIQTTSTPNQIGSGPVGVNVSIAAGAAHDGAANASVAASSTTVINADPFDPTITMTATSASPTLPLAPLTVTVTFGESVTGFTQSDLVATNGTVSNFSGSGAIYTFTLTPTAAGVVTVEIAAGAANDAIGNTSLAGHFNTTTDQTSSGLTGVIPDINAAEWQAIGTEGLKFWDVQTGTGTAVPAGASLTAYYTGWLLNGTAFNDVRTNGQAITFSLNGVIDGWEQGIPGMKPGGIRRLYIPAALAYGNNPPAGIPIGADLVFEVKMVSWT